MNIVKNLFMTCLLALVLNSVNASDGNKATTTREEIKEMVQNANLASSAKESVTLKIDFMVNAKNEIIILSTDNRDLDNTIKSILNYKKLQIVDLDINKTYTLPIVIKKK